MMINSRKFRVLPSLFLALAFLSAAPAYAGPVVLSCKDNDNLYDAPYTVSINAKLMSVSISRSSGFNHLINDSYQITDIQNYNGSYVVTADGKLFNSHIVVSYGDSATIAYSDAFTDRPIAIDDCTSVAKPASRTN